MNGPDLYPDVVRAMAERRELFRRAYLLSIARAESGQYVDPHYLRCARDFVAANPPLAGPLGTGEPPVSLGDSSPCSHSTKRPSERSMADLLEEAAGRTHA